jgi:uncharacterized membrane protein
MKAKHLIYMLSLLLIMECVLGYSIASHSASFDVVGNKVMATHALEFDGAVTDVFVLALPAHEKLELYLDDKAAEPFFDGNELSLELVSVKSLTLKYETSEYLDGSSFLLDMVLPADTSVLEMELRLPEGLVLMEPLKEDDARAGSIYPKPDKATTDGKNMIFSWEWKDLAKGHEIPIYVRYKKSTGLMGYALPVVAVIIIFGAVVSMLLFLKKPKSITSKENTITHLKEEEEAIVNILKQRDEHMCEQGTLRVITGMPKASLSRLLKELEDRKVVYREKRGKKNLVFLRE